MQLIVNPLDPMELHPICGISPGFPQIPSEIPQNLELIYKFKVLPTQTYSSKQNNFNSFNLIYWTPICGKYFLDDSFFEKRGKIWKNGRFSGRLRPDWGNNPWAAMAGLRSIGLNEQSKYGGS